MKAYLSILCTLVFYSLYAQTPGGVVTHNTNLWLKADVGTSCSTDGCVLSTWMDQGFIGSNHATQSNATNQPTYKVAGTNYHPSISIVADANPTFQYFDLPNATLPTGGSSYTVFFVANRVSKQGFVIAGGTPTNHDCNRFRIGKNGTLKNSWASITGGELLTLSNERIAQRRALASFNYDGVSGVRTIRANGKQKATTTFTGITMTASSNRIGVREDLAPSMVGEINEVIVYPTSLSLTEEQRVESYLALKYGITIDETSGGTQGDYYASDGSLIWDASQGDIAFHNEIIAIGRDDASGLNQKQAIGIDDTTILYISNLATQNDGNSGMFSVDMSYCLLGHNNGAMQKTIASKAELPTGLGVTVESKLDREWRLDRVNCSDNINMEFLVSNVVDYYGVNSSDLCLLVDDDGDFSNGGTQAFHNLDGTGLAINYVGQRVQILGLSTTHVSNNSTVYISVGSMSANTPLSNNKLDYSLVCNKGATEIHWELPTEEDIRDRLLSIDIEQSFDGISFTSIDQIEDIYPKHVWRSPYKEAGATYYRLKQTYRDGSTDYTHIEAISCRKDKRSKFFPNPIKQTMYLELEERQQISIVNAYGQRLQTHFFSSGVQELDLSELPAGVYILEIGGQQRASYTFIKE